MRGSAIICLLSYLSYRLAVSESLSQSGSMRSWDHLNLTIQILFAWMSLCKPIYYMAQFVLKGNWCT